MIGKDSSRVGGKGGGSRRKYETPDDMRDKIKDYFAFCEEGEIPMTVVGMAAFLDLSASRLNRYRQKEYDHVFEAALDEEDEDNFSDVVQKAKEYIENDKWVKGLLGKYNPAVLIFDLKNNHDCTDRRDLNLDLKDNRPIIVDDVPKIEDVNRAVGTAIITLDNEEI